MAGGALAAASTTNLPLPLPPPPLACDSGSMSSCWCRGFAFVGEMLLIAAIYVLGGVAYNFQRHGKRGVEALPHRPQWIELHGLFRDGVGLTRRKALGLVGRGDGRGPGKEPMVTKAAKEKKAKQDTETHKGHASPTASKASKGSGSPKEKGQSKKQKSGKDGTRGGGSQRTNMEEAAATTMEIDGSPSWSGPSAALQEQRDTTVHSSQAKVKVVLDGSKS